MSDPRQAPFLVVPPARCGPATSGNGGWTSGALATLLLATLPDDRSGDAVRVRLSAPPPLDVPMPVVAVDGGLRATSDGAPVAEAMLLPDDAASALLRPPPAECADPDEAFNRALAAGERYPGLVDHPFPTCFSCGTARGPGDGLQLRPGAIGATGSAAGTATAWIPHPAFDSGDGRVSTALVWAALDCPGGWSAGLSGRPMVLGTMTARVVGRPRVGERCVVRGVADPASPSGRSVPTRTALYGETGTLLATAAQVWVVVDPARFN